VGGWKQQLKKLQKKLLHILCLTYREGKQF
jgi:hypothetical protein